MGCNLLVAGSQTESRTSGVSVLVLGGSSTLYCKGTVAWPGVLMSALALANGWEPAWHKDVAVSFSLS